MRKDSHPNKSRPDVPATDAAAGGSLTSSAQIGRRDFVKGGALMIVAACANPHDLGVTGTIHLVLNGLHPAATSGGSAVITSTASGEVQPTVDIPASGDQSRVVPVGDFTVQYTAPASHLLAAGQANPFTVTILENQVTTVTINLVAMGSIQVTVTGLVSASTGGSAVAQRTDASGSPVNITITAAGAGSAPVPAGTYTVTYSAPAGYSVSTSPTNPAVGVVVGITAAPVNFTVTSVATGNVAVTATGLTGATAGGSASAKLSDNTGSTFPTTLPAPTAGTSSNTISGLPPGSYNITYTPPSGFSIQAGTLNPQLVTVTSGGTATATFPTQANAAGPVIAFASDWHTAVGTGNTAVSDGGKWDLSIDNGSSVAPDRRAVIAASGLAFPAGMANVLKIRHPDALVANYYWNVLVVNGWQLPAIGDSLYKRIYFRHDIAGTDTADMHSLSTGPPGACPFTWGFQFARVGTTQFNFSMSNQVSGNEHIWTFKNPLNRQATYRLECQFVRQATDSWKLHGRLYDSSNVLIGQDADFNCTWHGTHTLATYTGNVSSVTDCHRNLMIGQQQQPGRGSTDPAHESMFYGGFAISLSDWLGPYTAGEAG